MLAGIGFGAGLQVMNADGSDLRGLSIWFYNEGKPAWSPDGTRIAIVATSNISSQAMNCVFVMNADGSGMTCVDDRPAGGRQVAWSPDGARILFSTMPDRAILLVALTHTVPFARLR